MNSVSKKVASAYQALVLLTPLILFPITSVFAENIAEETMEEVTPLFFQRSLMTGDVNDPLTITISSDQKVVETPALAEESPSAGDHKESEEIKENLGQIKEEQTTDSETDESNGSEGSSDLEQTAKSEKLNGEDETNTNQEIETEQIDSARNSMWGNVSWRWEPSTRTITLQGGYAGSNNSAPWKTHRDVVRIIIESRVILPANSSSLFSSLPDLEIIDNAERLDTSNVTNMSSMFQSSRSLETLNVSNWDTSNVTNMGWMFFGNRSLETLNVSNWDTSNVTDMGSMFQNTESLKALEVSNWDTSNVTSMVWMFDGSRSLETLNVSNWDTSNVTNMLAMFQNTESLKALDVSNWDTSNVTDMGSMFNGSRSLESLNISNWNTTNVFEATNMFSNTTSLSKLYLGTRSRFNHLSNPPAMPVITSSDNYTGRWVYYWNQTNTIPEAYIISSSANFWREYDGSNPGTYQWQKKGSVAVHYRDINDQEVIAPKIITGGVREPFQVEKKALEGYTLQEVPDNTSGRFTEEEQLVIFRYMKNTVDTVDPLNPAIKVDPENKPELPEDQGLLSIDFVSRFNFGSQVISAHDQIYYAQPQRLLNEDQTVNEDEERPNYVQVSDRRSENERNGWQLAVTQKEQFQTENAHDLAGAQLQLMNQQLVTAQGGKEPSLQATNPLKLVPGNKRTLVRAEGSEGTSTWVYRFGNAASAGESVALHVPKGATPEAKHYTTTLIWELSAVPRN